MKNKLTEGILRKKFQTKGASKEAPLLIVETRLIYISRQYLLKNVRIIPLKYSFMWGQHAGKF